MKVLFDGRGAAFVPGIGDLQPGLNEVGDVEGERLLSLGLCRRVDEAPEPERPQEDVQAPATAEEKEL